MCSYTSFCVQFVVQFIGITDTARDGKATNGCWSGSGVAWDAGCLRSVGTDGCVLVDLDLSIACNGVNNIVMYCKYSECSNLLLSIMAGVRCVWTATKLLKYYFVM